MDEKHPAPGHSIKTHPADPNGVYMQLYAFGDLIYGSYLRGELVELSWERFREHDARCWEIVVAAPDKGAERAQLPPGKSIFITIHGDALTDAMRTAYALGDFKAMHDMCPEFTEAERLKIGEGLAWLKGDSRAGFKIVASTA